MIFAFLAAFIVLFFPLVNALPDIPSDTSSFNEAIIYVVSLVKSFDFILPVEALVNSASIATVAILGFYLIKLTKWILGITRGSNSE